MSKPIVISETSWFKIVDLLARDHPPSVLFIRNRMREVLGFTIRRHTEWIDQEVDLKDVRYGTKYSIKTIRLDFYNEPKRTMFLLKYSEHINNSVS